MSRRTARRAAFYARARRRRLLCAELRRALAAYRADPGAEPISLVQPRAARYARMCGARLAVWTVDHGATDTNVRLVWIPR